MTRWVALLRAVNVGGTGKLAMADLRAAAGAEGLERVSTILQSGSLVFSAPGTPEALQHRIEKTLAARLGLASDVMVRSAEQWSAIVAGNPFPEMAKQDPSHLFAFVLKRPTTVAQPPVVDGPERVHVAGDVLIAAYPDGIGRSKLTAARLERHFGVRGTGRNWSTVLKIAAALAN